MVLWRRKGGVTIPKLTRYEKARIVGARALQIALGAPVLVDASKLKNKDPITIAEEEFKRGVLPVTIRRRLPDGTYELVPLSELIKGEEE